MDFTRQLEGRGRGGGGGRVVGVVQKSMGSMPCPASLSAL